MFCALLLQTDWSSLQSQSSYIKKKSFFVHSTIDFCQCFVIINDTEKNILICVSWYIWVEFLSPLGWKWYYCAVLTCIVLSIIILKCVCRFVSFDFLSHIICFCYSLLSLGVITSSTIHAVACTNTFTSSRYFPLSISHQL